MRNYLLLCLLFFFLQCVYSVENCTVASVLDQPATSIMSLLIDDYNACKNIGDCFASLNAISYTAQQHDHSIFESIDSNKLARMVYELDYMQSLFWTIEKNSMTWFERLLCICHGMTVGIAFDEILHGNSKSVLRSSMAFLFFSMLNAQWYLMPRLELSYAAKKTSEIINKVLDHRKL